MSELWLSIVWVLAAALLGFGVSALFAGRLRLRRRLFLIPYVILAGGFLYAFGRGSDLDLAALLSRNWIWGVLVGTVVAAFLVINVRSQPLSRTARGSELAFDLTWAGLTYGILDALFLNLMPVIAVYDGLAGMAWTGSLAGRIAVGLVALAASLLVTLTYHLGYPEFRNRSVGLVLVGNGIITLAYLLSANPLGAIISHGAMHVAAVLQGPETTIQLPPHFQIQT